MLRNRLCLALLFTVSFGFAQELVKDINAVSTGQTNFGGKACVPCGGKVFVVAFDPIHGSELNVSDGTEAGTFVVKDIRPGPSNSLIFSPELTCANNNIFFRTTFGEIWRSDGTEQGTVKASATSGPYLTEFKGNLLYIEDRKLVMLDGTTSNKTVLTEISLNANERGDLFFITGDDYVFIRDIRVSNSTGGLIANDLWVYNGTTTTFLETYPTGTIELWTTIHNKLIFSARDDDHGNEFRVSDGTVAGTKILLETGPGPEGAIITPAPVKINGSVLLSPSLDGTNTWKTDGTPTGTTLLYEDFRADDASLFKGRLYIFGQRVSEDDSWEPVVRRTNLDFTSEVDVTSGPHGQFKSFGIVGDKLLYRDYSDGNEVHILDGITDSPTLLKDINEDSQGSEAHSAVNVNDDLLVFMADDGIHGSELWKTDGTTVGTNLVKDISNITANPQIGSIYLHNDKLYFIAIDGPFGDGIHHKLWMSDGTEGGTEPVNDTPAYGIFAPINDQIVLADNLNRKITKTDLNTKTTEVIADAPDDFGYTPNKGIAVGNDTYFYSPGDNTGFEVWRANPVTNEFSITRDINPGTGSSNVYDNIDGAGVNNKLVFMADDSENGAEPWVTDGTESGTFLLKDVHPTGSSYPSNFTSLNNHVLFFTEEPTKGVELWSSDGTIDGTIPLKQVGGSFQQPLGIIGNKALFCVINSTQGPDLWITDGTLPGTAFLKQLPRPDRSIGHFMNVGSKVYFFVSSEELWVTDGTDAGTTPIDFNFNETFSFTKYTTSGDMLVFSSSFEIWSTLGTPESTSLLANVQPLSELFVIGDHVYFVKDDPTYSREVFKVQLPTYQDQEITVVGLEGEIKFGPTYDLQINASSGLDVNVESSDETIAEIIDNQLISYKTGTVTFTFTQNGSATYRPVTRKIDVTIQKGDQTITFNPIDPINFESPEFPIIATTTSQLPLTYSATENTHGKVTLEGNFATIVERGSIIITVSQNGNENYNAAEPVSQEICLSPEHPTISQQMTGPTITLVSSASTNVWALNNEELDDVTGMTLTPTLNGVYRAAAVVDGCKSLFSDPLNVIVTGLGDTDDSIEIFPNPVSDLLFVKTATHLRIIDAQGREVFNQFVEENLDVTSLTPGFYIAIANNRQYKFVKRR